MTLLQRLALPADKANHAVWGFIGAAVAGAVVFAIGQGAHAGWVGAAAALVANVIKEALDDMANEEAAAMDQPLPHTVDPIDVLAGTCGGMAWWLAHALGSLASAPT